MTELDPEVASGLIEIINSVYRDEVDEVLQYQLEGSKDDFLVLARDGPKQLAIKITDTDISIRLLNPKAIAGNNPTFAEPDSGSSTVDRFLTQLQRQAQPQIAGMVSQLQELLDSSADLVEFREKLDTAYPDLDGQDLTQIMAQAMFASKLAGVFEAEQDAD